MTIMRANKKPFDATQLLDNYGDACLGEFKVQEVHIKSRADFETPDG